MPSKKNKNKFTLSWLEKQKNIKKMLERYFESDFNLVKRTFQLNTYDQNQIYSE